MRGIPDWLRNLSEVFLTLPAQRQRAFIHRIADELEVRTARVRDRIRTEDLPAFDTAADGIVRSARELADTLGAASEPYNGAALIELALDNRGISLLESIEMQAVRAAALAEGLSPHRR